MVREKEVSTRLLKPTLPNINADQVLDLVEHWDPHWETDASIAIFDEGIAQYLLVDIKSHLKFYAALILGKPSLRCRLVTEEPEDVLDNDYGNKFNVSMDMERASPEDLKKIDYLKQVLYRRGYRFD